MRFFSSKIRRGANYEMPWTRSLGRKCSMDGTVPIKVKSSICLKGIITTFFLFSTFLFLCDRCPYCNDSSDMNRNTLSCLHYWFPQLLFWPYCALLFPDSVIPFLQLWGPYLQSKRISETAFGKGHSRLWLAAWCSVAESGMPHFGTKRHCQR